ncbi:MAG: hypothetical protein HRF49_01755 [bacterium]
MKPFWFFAVLLALPFLFSSCGSGSNVRTGGPDTYRGFDLVGDRFGGKAPYEWHYTVYAVPGIGDPQGTVNLISKVEIDFGDGGGWIDCTQELRKNWLGLPDANPMHVFDQPGTYLVKCRVVYFDGAGSSKDDTAVVEVT